ncbi:MAG: DNA replication factor GINS [Natronomonas sp.]|jgi:DNA replication factor GINS|uniref:DNA replication complex subunit Gins51 n=1 Tax=Natronomonas sp. TaxID=2184060 RepID=UPI003988B3B0
MNLDELQSVQARERQSSDLQHLRSSFYREVGEYIQELTERRAQVVDQADDPFSSPEVRQLTDDIETAEQTVEAIYERRVGKVVKKASIAAADMPVDDDGLTQEEEALFEDLVARIEQSRDTVLSVLDGDAPSVSCSVDGATDSAVTSPETTAAPSGGDEQAPESTPEPDFDPDPLPSDTDGVSAADLMGSGPDTEPAAETDPVDAAPGTEDGASEPTQGAKSESETAAPTEVPPDSEPPGEPPNEPDEPSSEPEDERPAPTSSERDIPGIPRTTVRVTADVGEVVGADNRDYDLGPEDVVTLPEPNADVLVDKDAAERLE